MNNNLFELINDSFQEQADTHAVNLHRTLKKECDAGAEPNDISRMLTVLPLCGLFTAKNNIALGVNSQTIIEFKNKQFNYVVKLSGTTLTSDDETVLLFLNELALKNKSRIFITQLFYIVVGSFFVNCGDNFIRAKNSLDALNTAVIDTYFSAIIKGKKISKGFKGHIIENYEYENLEMQTGYITITISEKYYQSLSDKKNPIRLLNRRSRAKCKSNDQKNTYTILATWKYERLNIDNLMNIIKTAQRKIDFIRRCVNPLLSVVSQDRKQKVYLCKDSKNIIFSDKPLLENKTSIPHHFHESNAPNGEYFAPSL